MTITEHLFGASLAWGHHLDPNNEDGRDHDKGNGPRLAHVQPFSSLVRIARTQRAGAM